MFGGDAAGRNIGGKGPDGDGVVRPGGEEVVVEGVGIAADGSESLDGVEGLQEADVVLQGVGFFVDPSVGAPIDDVWGVAVEAGVGGVVAANAFDGIPLLDDDVAEAFCDAEDTGFGGTKSPIYNLVGRAGTRDTEGTGMEAGEGQHSIREEATCTLHRVGSGRSTTGEGVLLAGVGRPPDGAVEIVRTVTADAEEVDDVAVQVVDDLYGPWGMNVPQGASGPAVGDDEGVTPRDVGQDPPGETPLASWVIEGRSITGRTRRWRDLPEEVGDGLTDDGLTNGGLAFDGLAGSGLTDGGLTSDGSTNGGLTNGGLSFDFKCG